jgi:hypothetical protein
MTQKTYPVQVVGAALVDDLDHPARLLVACRSAPEALAGLWEFPGRQDRAGGRTQWQHFAGNCERSWGWRSTSVPKFRDRTPRGGRSTNAWP